MRLPRESFLRRYCAYGWLCTDAPLIFHVAGALSILTQIAPIELCCDFNSCNYANLFLLLVARSSSSRKTTAINLAQRILKDAAFGAIGPKPGSMEGLSTALCNQPRQIVFYEEFGSFLSSTEKGYLQPLKAALNSAWDCDPVSRGLSKSSRTEPNPRLTLFAGCAPGFLDAHTHPTDWTEGFFARWLVFAAERERTYPIGNPQPDRRNELTAEVKRRAHHSRLGLFNGLSPGAKQVYIEWTAQTEALAMKKYAEHEFALATFARASANVLRVATLLSYDCGEASTGEPWQITTQEIEPAIAIGNLHLTSVRAVTANLVISPTQRDRQTVLRAVSDKRPTRLGTIITRSRLLKNYVETHIASLIEEGKITAVPTVSGDRKYIRLADQPDDGDEAEEEYVEPEPSIFDA